MTNLERIKTTLCNTINSMSEDTLFEFLSEYEDDEETYFPKGTIFKCTNCHELYGDCEVNIDGEVNYQTCKNRFHVYSSAECE